MNIFVLDYNPMLAAQYHCDKHCSKMILETAQLLSTSHHILNSADAILDNVYKPTHVNHPCAKWVRESSENYLWAFNLYIGLCEEFQFRRIVPHKSMELFPFLSNIPRNIPNADMTPFALAMPNEYKQDDPVESYRNYYLNHKQSMATWSWGREAPDWWKKGKGYAQVTPPQT